MTTSPIDQLAAALDATGRLASAVSPDQWSLTTPCTEWNVEALLRHVVGGNYLFAAALRHDESRPELPADPAGLSEAYRLSGEELLAAFRVPGVLDQLVTVPFGTVPGMVALYLRITEVLTHGWDLARATGRPADFPEDAVEAALAFSEANLGNIPPGRSPFAPPQAVPDGAAAIERLAGCLGRAVTR